jgi:hypothetical protein
MKIRLLFLVASVAAFSDSALAQTSCDLQGAWQLVSAKYDNQALPSSNSWMKIFTKTRFAVVGLDTAFLGPLVTDADRLKFLSNMNAVGGSYVVSGGGWTEKIEYFPDPTYIGLSATFQCVQEGDRLTQKGTFPVFEKGKKTRDMPLEEVWRRIDRP